MKSLRRFFSSRVIELRSDTKTLPLPKMRLCMAEAQVGDDVANEDPTVNVLQERVARLFNKEAALFTPSGSMANLLSVLSYCGQGDQVLLGDLCHVIYYEQGSISSVGGVMARSVRTLDDGTLDLENLQEQIMPEGQHFPRSKLVLLENTHNNCGGTVLSQAYVTQVSKICKSNGLKLHIDGARILNAYVYLKQSNPSLKPSDLVADVDSLSLCFSKGLSCPVGSIIVGSQDFINRAHRWRQCLGGGMRKVGVLAAPAIVSLDMAESILTADHANAQILAQGLKEMKCTVSPVQTNIINFSSGRMSCVQLVERLKEKGVLVGTKVGDKLIRAVTNSTVSQKDVYTALERFKEILN